MFINVSLVKKPRLVEILCEIKLTIETHTLDILTLAPTSASASAHGHWQLVVELCKDFLVRDSKPHHPLPSHLFKNQKMKDLVLEN